MSLSLSQSCEIRQYVRHSTGSDPYSVWVRAALKAFKKFTHKDKVFYTCNITRLNQCNRLGDAKDVSMWRTHFFLCSKYFDEVSGAVFSSRPGEELARFTRSHDVLLYLKVSDIEIMDVRNGAVIELDTPLVFASEEVLLV